jgi:uncharacterized membrane protein YkvA (DUF1232 family)
VKKTTLNKVLAGLGILIGGIYIVNPGAGLLELIPDLVPFVGNLDEAGATALVLWGIQALRKPEELPALPDAMKGTASESVKVKR